MMTFHESFYAEQLFLDNAKLVLERGEADDEYSDFGEVASAVMSCAFALEALANALLKVDGRIKHYDKIEIKAKLEVLGILASIDVDFGKSPWQHIARLVGLRNWLVHYKDPYIGLMGSGGYVSRKSKFSPSNDLTLNELKRYYDAVRECMAELANGLGQKEQFLFLSSEEYEPIMMG